MSIEKIEEKLHIKSNIGQSIFESILTGALFFIIVFCIFGLLKMVSPSNALKASLVSGGFGAFIGFFGKFKK
jgi:hypothetical protein